MMDLFDGKFIKKVSDKYIPHISICINIDLFGICGILLF